MKAILINGRFGQSRVLIGESIVSLAQYAPLDRTVIVTDDNVLRHWQERLPSSRIIAIPPGEASKTLKTVEQICVRLMEMGADRSYFLVGIGGGVVSDVAGFSASIFMRGIPFGFVSTTLLAQVDAGIGGKNGVNLAGYKNMVGVFNQPRFVICDPDLLKTLPKREVLAGFAEIVKHALIADADLFSFLEANAAMGASLKPAFIERVVRDSLLIKAGIVGRDEQEKEERRILNFGHTFGHALERITGISHGEAVSIGMVIAARLSCLWGYLELIDAQRIEVLLRGLGLPTTPPSDPTRFIEAIQKDKKRVGDAIHLVLLDAVGHGFVRRTRLWEVEKAMVTLLSRTGRAEPLALRRDRGES